MTSESKAHARRSTFICMRLSPDREKVKCRKFDWIYGDMLAHKTLFGFTLGFNATSTWSWGCKQWKSFENNRFPSSRFRGFCEEKNSSTFFPWRRQVHVKKLRSRRLKIGKVELFNKASISFSFASRAVARRKQLFSREGLDATATNEIWKMFRKSFR